LSPDDPHLHYNLGLALSRLGRRDEAAAHLRRALERNPGDTAAWRELDALNHNH
jgi:Flp pilus assembly protein TadD